MDRLVCRICVPIILKIIIVCFLATACSKDEFTIMNLNNNEITMLGHGGIGAIESYPKNSYESIVKCLSLGMDGTELDVQITKDSVPVVFHDEDLSESTNLKGRIIDHTWAEIKNAYYTKYIYTNYSIISLEQLFSTVKNITSYRFSFDCKLYATDVNRAYCSTFVNALATLLDKYGLDSNFYIESGNQQFLTIAKTQKPHYKLLVGTEIQSGIEIANALHLSGIIVSTDNVSKEQIESAHSNGLLVAVWNIKTKKEHVAAIEKNPDVIQTDSPKTLLDLLQ